MKTLLLLSLLLPSFTNAAELTSDSPMLSNLAGAAVTNACSPGGLAALTGSSLTTEAPQAAVSYPLPKQLAGLQVIVNGNPAPLLFASDSEVRFQCPLLTAGTPLEITIGRATGGSQSVEGGVMQAARPELPNQIAIAGQPGNTVTLYASGLGDFTGTVAAGTPAPAGALIPLQNEIRVMVGGTQVTPVSAGLAPGTVGLSQVNIQLPPDIANGPAVPLYVRVILPNGTVLESNEVTIAIQ